MQEFIRWWSSFVVYTFDILKFVFLVLFWTKFRENLRYSIASILYDMGTSWTFALWFLFSHPLPELSINGLFGMVFMYN